MEIPGGAGLLRWIRRSLSLALLLLVGGLAGVGAGQPAIGYVLLGTAGIACCVGCCSLLVLRQARQRPELEDAFRDYSR
jgi:uncharacterized membrane protein YuzA (DUF378 family)